jgi:ferredoxin-nitrate reductase
MSVSRRASKKTPERWTASTCPYCGVGCGVEVGVKNGKISAIRGDKSHPANYGKLCPKPAGLPEAIHAESRLTHLMRRNGKGDLERVSWDDALEELAGRLEGVLERHGPLGAAFYISGQLLTEDYYAVNKLAKGFLGTNNLDSNSRLCMTSAVSGYKGAFGTDGPPASYADITRAECFLLWGTNTAECHPVTFGRIKERKKDPSVSVVVVDPRRTPTADIADLHLPIKPGTDLALANAMLWVLIEESLVNRRFVDRHTNGFEEAAAAAREWPPERAARVCGVLREDIVRAALMFGESKASMSLWTMGVNQSAVGTMKNRAIINLHLAAGQIGKPGSGPFSLTGQPNAMAAGRSAASARACRVTARWRMQSIGARSRKPGVSSPAAFRRCRGCRRRRCSGLWRLTRQSSCGSLRPTRQSPCRTSRGRGGRWRTRSSWWSRRLTPPRRPGTRTLCSRRPSGARRPGR